MGSEMCIRDRPVFWQIFIGMLILLVLLLISNGVTLMGWLKARNEQAEDADVDEQAQFSE